MNTKNILSVKNLKKIYSNKQAGDKLALNDLNLDVKIIDISTDDGGLEDVFLRLIKN